MGGKPALLALLTAWPEHAERFGALAAQVGDWPGLLELAERHGVLGILAEPLAAHCPEALRETLAMRRRLQDIWNERLTRALEAIAGALAAAGVAMVPLKGPVLAERLYAEPSVRFALDLDLLVAPADLARATDVLDGLGYGVVQGPQARYELRHHHHLSFRQPQQAKVELHFRLFAGFGTCLEAEAFIGRARPYRSRRGTVYAVLAPEDEFLYLCVHAAGHGYERVSWLYDLKAFLRQHPDLDWQAIDSRARAARLTTALGFTCDLLERRLGVRPIWPTRAERPRFPAATRWLGFWERSAEGSLRHKYGLSLFLALLCDRPADAGWFLLHHFGRTARRRIYYLFPRLTPEDWAG
jgi:Uncharacterised nucleotidyltransferase